MARRTLRKQYMVCVKNDGYPVSLVVRRIYVCLPDAEGAEHGMLRIIDESGEDYLYPAKFFLPIEVPRGAARAFSRAS